MGKVVHDREQWLSPSEVARMFHVSPITVRSWANSGYLKPQLTPGGHRRFSLREVQSFASERGGLLGPSTSAKLETDSEPNISTVSPQVLIVDDDADIAELLGEHIKRLRPGVELLYAIDGFEAGSLMQEHVPSLIFIDIMMPGIRGDSVCRFIKRNPKARHVPVVGMTGFPSQENVERMQTAGALAVVGKPFDMQELSTLVSNTLGGGVVGG